MNRSVTKWLNRFTGVGVASSLPPTSALVPMRRLTEQERQGILAYIRSLDDSRGNPRT
jgi:hypothetical protein